MGWMTHALELAAPALCCCCRRRSLTKPRLEPKSLVARRLSTEDVPKMFWMWPFTHPGCCCCCLVSLVTELLIRLFLRKYGKHTFRENEGSSFIVLQNLNFSTQYHHLSAKVLRAKWDHCSFIVVEWMMVKWKVCTIKITVKRYH